MRALVLNATLKPSPESSNTEALARVVADALAAEQVEVSFVRLADHRIDPGVVSEAVSDGDEWPAIHAQILAADILIMATPTWVGQPSSLCQRAIERMDAMLSETDDQERPVAYNKVAGIVVTGNEDGAHHIIANVGQALNDIGYSQPGQNWTYWNKGPGPSEEEYASSDEQDWSNATGRACASNLLHLARALEGSPIPAPPS
jgi:multimeric flavodoxin WrbA